MADTRATQGDWLRYEVERLKEEFAKVQQAVEALRSSVQHLDYRTQGWSDVDTHLDRLDKAMWAVEEGVKGLRRDHTLLDKPNGERLLDTVKNNVNRLGNLERWAQKLEDAHKETKKFWLGIIASILVASTIAVTTILFKSHTLPMTVEMRLKEMEDGLEKKVQEEVRKRSVILPFAPQMTPP